LDKYFVKKYFHAHRKSIFIMFLDLALSRMNLLLLLKPSVPKRYLLFIAGIVWTIAGGMLLFKGISLFRIYRDFLWLKITISIIGGGLFYLLLFSKISFKHAWRIINLKYENPCMFSFFNIRSYIMMAVMITSGVILRKTGIISPEYLSVLYVMMGIPLFLSALRFYYYEIYYRTIIYKNIT
jgi:hypothetical protein